MPISWCLVKFTILVQKSKFKYNMEVLKWPQAQHSNHIGNMLQNLRNFGELADVTIVCDDDIQIKAHKAILSTFSPVIKKILNSLQQTDSVIHFAGVDLKEVVSILEFMYLGQTVITKAECRQLLAVARDLEIMEIVEKVEEFFGHVEKERSSLTSVENNSSFQPSAVENLQEIVSYDPKPQLGYQPFSRQFEHELQKGDIIMNINNVDLHGIKRGRGRPPGSMSEDLKKMRHKDLFEYCGIKRGRGRPKKEKERKSKLEWELEQVRDMKKNLFYAEATENNFIGNFEDADPRKKEQCPICGKKFTQMPQLVEHVTMVHDKQGECPECGKILSSKATLAFHLQSVHNEEDQKNPMSKNATCPECNKTFVTRQVMLQHRLSMHEGVKYRCRYEGCDYKATQPNHLTVHAQSVHLKIRYPCDQCHHTFSTTTHVRRHQISQHGMVSSGQIPAGVSELTGKVVMQRTIGRPRQSQLVEGVEKPGSPNSRATDEEVNHEDTEEALGVRDILNFYRSNNEDDHADLDREIESRILESRERNEIDPSEKNVEAPADSVLSQTSDPLMALEDNIVTAAL